MPKTSNLHVFFFLELFLLSGSGYFTMTRLASLPFWIGRIL